MEKTMIKKGWITPPECCVIIEMEKGASLGYRKAVLLKEIQVLGSLSKAAKVAKIDLRHARELIQEMNAAFSRPLVAFRASIRRTDNVELTEAGEKAISSYWRQFGPVWESIIEERSRHY
jgi:molybdate transport system regulatory protein